MTSQPHYCIYTILLRFHDELLSQNICMFYLSRIAFLLNLLSPSFDSLLLSSFFRQEGIVRLEVIVAPLCVNVCCSYYWLNHNYDKLHVVIIMTVIHVVGCNGIIVHKCASLLWLAWLHLYMIHRQFSYFDGFYYIPTSIGSCHS